ncbi:MAG: hypothetical protein H6Q90_7290 [Deltaproteobacteria bacterium]|nr:hypothetical protein [Deltaproteobacteria bacterium]
MRIWLFALAISLGATACGGSKKGPKAPTTEDEKSDRESDTGARDSSQPDDADDMPSQSSDDPMGDGDGGGGGD